MENLETIFQNRFGIVNPNERKIGPEIEGILFSPKTPNNIPSVEEISELFENIASGLNGAADLYNERIQINGETTYAYSTKVKFEVNDYFVEITTGISRCTFEMTVPPSRSLSENERNLKYIFEKLLKGAENSRLEILGLGAHPFAEHSNESIMPKLINVYLSERLDGNELKRLITNASSQFHVELSRNETESLPNMLMRFIPPIVALTCNSAIIEGEFSGYKEYRSYALEREKDHHMEESRAGLPPNFFSADNNYFRYLISHSPIISRRRDMINGFYITFDDKAKTFSDFINKGTTEARRTDSGNKITVTPELVDLVFLEGTVWPEVRLRSTFGTAEFRPCSFQPSADEILAIGAVVKGLVNNYIEASRLVEKYDIKTIREAHRSAMRYGPDAHIGGESLLELSKRMLYVAARGLDGNEKQFLRPMEKNAESGKSPADRSIAYFTELLKRQPRNSDFTQNFVEKHRFKI
jgi:gamma-glutamylcysteine synthetase